MGLDLTVQLVVFRLLAGLLLVAVHGATLAAVAVLLGDRGPKHDGRLTLVPFGHIDLLGLGSLVLTGFGWSKPVAIDPTETRVGRWGPVIATLAGSAALLAFGSLILLLVIPLLTVLPYTAGIGAAAFVRLTAQLCVWMALLALVPLPPLAGTHLLAALGIRLPSSAGMFVGWALLLASILGVTRMVLTPAYDLVAPLVIAGAVAR